MNVRSIAICTEYSVLEVLNQTALYLQLDPAQGHARAGGHHGMALARRLEYNSADYPTCHKELKNE